ncbi:MAG: hypothetical protein IIB61_02910 [Planctomycetes bacterium]|nr:hypothetical protein [Planctomycetota bacterium]
MTTSDVVDTNEHGATPDRGFTYDANLAAGQYTRTGPDGVETFATLDDAGRLATLRRGPSGTPVMTATYTYRRNDLVDKVTYGNTTFVDYLGTGDSHRFSWARAPFIGDCPRFGPPVWPVSERRAGAVGPVVLLFALPCCFAAIGGGFAITSLFLGSLSDGMKEMLAYSLVSAVGASALRSYLANII